jgi:hypothetical protein
MATLKNALFWEAIAVCIKKSDVYIPYLLHLVWYSTYTDAYVVPVASVTAG